MPGYGTGVNHKTLHVVMFFSCSCLIFELWQAVIHNEKRGAEMVKVVERELVGKSSRFQAALRQVEIVAPADCAVLLQGETGTGKELFARAVHEQSGRARGPFIKVNCAAIPA